MRYILSIGFLLFSIGLFAQDNVQCGAYCQSDAPSTHGATFNTNVGTLIYEVTPVIPGVTDLSLIHI